MRAREVVRTSETTLVNHEQLYLIRTNKIHEPQN